MGITYDNIAAIHLCKPGTVLLYIVPHTKWKTGHPSISFSLVESKITHAYVWLSIMLLSTL